MWHIIDDDGHLSNWKVKEGCLIMSFLDKGVGYTFIHRRVPCLIHALHPWPIHVPLHHHLGRVGNNIATMLDQLQLVFGLTNPYMPSCVVLIKSKQSQIHKASFNWGSMTLLAGGICAFAFGCACASICGSTWCCYCQANFASRCVDVVTSHLRASTSET